MTTGTEAPSLRVYQQTMNPRRKSFEGAHVAFDKVIEHNIIESEKNNRAIFDEVVVVRVRFPGQAETVVRAQQKHFDEYPAEYQAFLKNEEPPVSGTPLVEWPLISRSLAESLKHEGVKTVEDLCTLTEDAKRRLGPIDQYIQAAKDYLKRAEGDVKISTLQVELRSLKKQNETLTKLVERMALKLEAETGEKIELT